MSYKNIKKHLGEEWLNNQIKIFETKKWIKIEPKKELSNEPAFYLLKKIDELLLKFEKVDGFFQWTLEAKTTKIFENVLFELMVLDNLLLNSDSLKLKVINSSNNSIPEALIKKGEDVFYVEMTKLKGIPKSIQNKVNNLFTKSKTKFNNSQGIHFIGVFDFFEYPTENEKILPQFNLLKKFIQLRFERGFGSSIIAFVLVNFIINTNFKKSSILKKYYLINKPLEKGGKPSKFFEDIFDVDDFIYD
ncbi:MAG: hypothetical protein ISS82_05695 [Nanoarchaeota archaeon]|nr:hypothetical protein [Nanoarchaeota archaeon]